ncbi:MAG TPA: FmdB family transcriptional regulator [Intrasporangiaceae bacterium]|nr:FmdB family transcriptional regulator [Intrasporangiaceae bacterium]
MPTYAYACTECEHRFDIVQSFSDDALTVCPECGGRLRKLFNAVGVVFKGSGFYRTDSRESTSGARSSGTSGSSGDSGSSDSGSSSATAGSDAKGSGSAGSGSKGSTTASSGSSTSPASSGVSSTTS